MTDFERVIGALAVREVVKEQQDIFSLSLVRGIFVSFPRAARACLHGKFADALSMGDQIDQFTRNGCDCSEMVQRSLLKQPKMIKAGGFRIGTGLALPTALRPIIRGGPASESLRAIR
ncbi:hypothetical protein [Bradyrhizobium sp. TM239]|uniref:hypothetical protein n=1 Tax=Bradyrhizobium sp. TM239 TaxID=2599802 RepID=UPI0027D65FFC|nr:hypothetical protein TM239_17400 [Bradyrhizobium sp. TM239]